MPVSILTTAGIHTAEPVFTDGVWAATPSPNVPGRYNVTHTPTGRAVLLGVHADDCHVAVRAAADTWGRAFDVEGVATTIKRSLRDAFEERLKRARIDSADPRGPFGDGWE